MCTESSHQREGLDTAVRLALLRVPIETHLKPQTYSKDGTKALPAPYLEGSTILNHLDAVVGPENWRVEYKPVSVEGFVAFDCHLSIKVGLEWVTKSAIGEVPMPFFDEKTQKWKGSQNPTKSAQTDALKRAARAWGIGAFLNDLQRNWCRVKTWGEGASRRVDEWIDDPRKGLQIPTIPPRHEGVPQPPASLPQDEPHYEPLDTPPPVTNGNGSQVNRNRAAKKAWFAAKGKTVTIRQCFGTEAFEELDDAMLDTIGRAINKAVSQGCAPDAILKDLMGVEA